MAQFVSFSPNTEVHGTLVVNFINSLPMKKEVESIIIENGLKDPIPTQWYPLQDFLNAYNEIGRTFGPYILFNIGKTLLDTFQFSSKIKDIETAIKGLNEFYRNCHRGGEVGYYQIIGIDKERKEIRVECKNPYPCFLDRGMLTAITRKFKPEDAGLFNVELDTNKPNRLIGSDISIYTIMWN